jgi:hypothetical protein
MPFQRRGSFPGQTTYLKDVSLQEELLMLHTMQSCSAYVSAADRGLFRLFRLASLILALAGLAAAWPPQAKAITYKAHFGYSGSKAETSRGSASAQATANSTAATRKVFGSVAVGGSASASLTATFDKAGTLGKIAVVTQGAANLDFNAASTGTTCKVGSTYSSGKTCTVGVVFTPKAAGTRLGAVVLSDASGNTLAIGYLQGTGSGPQAAYGPGVKTTVVSGRSPSGLAVDGSGNVYLSDWGNGTAYKEKYSAGSYTQSKILENMSFPHDVAVDGAGNLYILDTWVAAVYEETPWGNE